MKDQPWDLNQTWQVVQKWCRFTNAPYPILGALAQILRRKNIKFLTTFFATSALDTAYLRNERRVDKPKCQFQSAMCPLNVDLLFMTFNPETAETRLLIVTHPSAAITLQPATCRVCYNSSPVGSVVCDVVSRDVEGVLLSQIL